MKSHALALVSLSLLAGCQSSLAPIESPAPLLNPDTEARFGIRLDSLAPIGGGIVSTTEGDKAQARTQLTAEGVVRFRSVSEVFEVDGTIHGFRYVVRGAETELDLTGTLTDKTMTVLDGDGKLVAQLPWSSDHRLGAPNESDLRASGFEEGAKTTRPCYIPWHDTQAVHLVAYTVEGPGVYTPPQQKEVPAFRLRLASPQEDADGSEHLVDLRGRLLQTKIQLGSIWIMGQNPEMTVYLKSRAERDAPGDPDETGN